MNQSEASQILKDNKEFIEGLTLGNVPDISHRGLQTVLEAAKELGVETNFGPCTCNAGFPDVARAIWNKTKEIEVLNTIPEINSVATKKKK